VCVRPCSVIIAKWAMNQSAFAVETCVRLEPTVQKGRSFRATESSNWWVVYKLHIFHFKKQPALQSACCKPIPTLNFNKFCQHQMGVLRNQRCGFMHTEKLNSISQISHIVVREFASSRNRNGRNLVVTTNVAN
jgi:hypothetical protein